MGAKPEFGLVRPSEATQMADLGNKTLQTANYALISDIFGGTGEAAEKAEKVKKPKETTARQSLEELQASLAKLPGCSSLPESEELATRLAECADQYSALHHYPKLVLKMIEQCTASLKADDLQDLVSASTVLHNNARQAEKDAKKTGTKGKSASKPPPPAAKKKDVKTLGDDLFDGLEEQD